MSKKHWTWDIPQVGEKEAIKVIKNENSRLFFTYAGMFLSRNDDVDYVFSILDKRLFCKYWPILRSEVNKGGWFDPYKESFWKPVYKKTIKELKDQGIKIHEFPDKPISKHRFQIALKFREIREEYGISQKDAALFLKVSQQYISKLETGQINVSIDKIWEFANMCVKGLDVKFI